MHTFELSLHKHWMMLVFGDLIIQNILIWVIFVLKTVYTKQCKTYGDSFVIIFTWNNADSLSIRY